MFRIAIIVVVVTSGFDAVGDEPKNPVPQSLKAPFTKEQARNAQKQWAKYLGTKPVFTNSFGMSLTLIPPGEYVMGGMEKEIYLKAVQDDRSRNVAYQMGMQHKVVITKPFFIGTNEVREYEVGEIQRPLRYQHLEQTYEYQGVPAKQLTWEKANDVCKLLSKHEGVKYRLPTEAEWEYACRAGTTTPYSTGEKIDETQANISQKLELRFFGKSSTPEKQYTAFVGSYAPNSFGLFDMHGNVNEWCNDWYGGDYYEKSPVEDPTGPKTSDFHVFRGGSCFSGEKCQSFLRLKPIDAKTAGKTAALYFSYEQVMAGMRVVLEVDSKDGKYLVPRVPTYKQRKQKQADEIAAGVAEERATSALEVIKKIMKSKPETAAKHLESLIERYPNTLSAKEAQKLLDALSE